MKKTLSCLLLTLLMATITLAQRVTDPLDRGLVAIAQTSGVYCSWRVLAEEYYGVTYNIYRDGTKLNDTPLTVSNYTDANGSTSSTYTVKAVKDGVEQEACSAVSVWSTKDGNSNVYLPIQVANVTDRNGTIVWQNDNGTVTYTANYTINDISLGDVDGDGKIDFIVKRKNQTDQDDLFPTSNTTAFCRIEVYASSVDYALLWYIDCGPNTVYSGDEQWDAVAFDWDQDGRCEVLYRAYANTIIHKSDGTTVTIGSASENIRAYVTHTSNMTFTNCGNEYLVYIDGKTGAPYVTMEYPLKRLESSEFSTSINWDSPTTTQVSNYLAAVKTAWGDNYGHRSSKYFMGAPYLDGRNPSIYLARGIYTRHKMIAYDVDPSTHALTEKWTWNNNTSGSSWYGQGYHSFCIADVDEDGRDEIVYGSMVIDDNGKGLSTTGLGHGDASHTGDLDPFTKGMETYACNEDNPGNNFRNAATCELYYRYEASGDDGRAMAGNCSNAYPGGIAASTSDGVLSLASHTLITELTNNWNGQTPSPMALNFRIYWDGDLEEETVNGPGSSEGNLFVDKLGIRIMTTEGTACINSTKKNPCATGDIIGDWREEMVMRSTDNTEFRIYTTATPTTYRVPCLWFDPAYRQAMVWQTEGYNQPPHVSYFMGELEGLTKVPVPLTMTGRTEIAATGDCIPTTANGSEVLAYGLSNIGIPTSGASPRVLTINVPSTVSGNGGSSISRSYSTSQLGYGSYKGDLTGTMNLVKQGDGLLKLTARTFSYTGRTDVYAGSLYFRGTLAASPVWLNRHTTLYTAGTYHRAVTMEYGSTLNINYTNSDGTTEYSTATIDTLCLHEGARVVFDIDPSNSQMDVLNMKQLSIRKQDWTYGPTYLAPVLEVTSTATLSIGSYPIGTLNTVDGSLSNIIIEGTCFAADTYQRLVLKSGVLYLQVYDDSSFIGSADNTTGWWGAFSDSYTIEPGKKYNFMFTNYSPGGENFYNWVLAVVNGTGHSTTDRADYAEYCVVRADNFGWGNNYATPSLSLQGGTLDWDTFKTDMMAGADVDMDVTFTDGVLSFEAVITSATGHVYDYSYSSTKITADEVTVFFTVDHCHMTVPVETVTTLNTDTIGATDNSSAYRAVFGPDITLTKGSAYHVQFQNHGSSEQAWYNWLLDITSGTDLVTTLRADWFAFGVGSFTDGGYQHSYDGGKTAGTNVWTNFTTDMTDATVDLTLAYSSTGVLTVNGTMTNGNDIYYYNYAVSTYTPTGGSATALADKLTLNLSVEKAWLKMIEQGTPYAAHTTANGQYATVCLPYSFEVAGADLYTISQISGTTIELTEVGTTGTAGTPYVYLSTSDDDEQTFTYTAGDLVSSPLAGDNGLTGCFSMTFAAGNYVLQTEDGLQGFYKTAAGDAVYCDPNTCYLVASSPVKAFYFGGETDATTVKNPNTQAAADSRIYDLTGRRLPHAQKGLIIIGNKKLVHLSSSTH